MIIRVGTATRKFVPPFAKGEVLYCHWISVIWISVIGHWQFKNDNSRMTALVQFNGIF